MKKILLLLLVLSLLLPQGVFANNSTDRQKEEELSIEQYKNMLERFSKDENSEIIFPYYYAGAYIEKSGKLVISVVDDKSEFKKELKEFTKNNDVKIKLKKNSYNNLVRIQKLLDENFDYFLSIGLNLVSVSKSIEQNVVIASFSNLNDDYQKLLDKKFKGLDIDFRLEKSESTDEVLRIRAGHKIYEAGTTSNFTVGFPATQRRYTNGVWSEVEGFVTCGHGQGYDDGINYSTSTGTLIGNVKTIILSGNTDASFVETNYDGDPVNILETGERITYATTYSYPEGTSIRMIGARSGEQTGTIMDPSASGNFPSGNFTDLVKTTYTSDGGDSGAPVIMGSGNYCTLLGIHKGRTGGYAHYVKYSNIKNRLGVSAIIN